MKHNFSFFIREGVSNMFSHGFMSFAAVGITVACLVIMGTFSLVAYNINENLKDLQRENAVVAFVDKELTDEEARALQSELEKLPNVADCTFVSREEAWESFKEQHKDNDLYTDFPVEKISHRYVLHLINLDEMNRTVTALRNQEGITKIRADEDISNGFLTVRNIAGVISITLIAILLIVSVFIISNTIKLTTFDRKDDIAIMKMVGATDGFIRWPFVYEGLLLGILSAAFAFCFQWLLYRAIAESIANSDTLQLLRIVPFEQIYVPVAIAFGAVGVFVGVGGSLTAIRRFLRV
ncbi:MAG: permease-like cell division protein FtsX [Oscillospiraceae bacterium]|nr:permease-like cell division protein FtsX [Oscillospiraceae bacterium]